MYEKGIYSIVQKLACGSICSTKATSAQTNGVCASPNLLPIIAISHSQLVLTFDTISYDRNVQSNSGCAPLGFCLRTVRILAKLIKKRVLIMCISIGRNIQKNMQQSNVKPHKKTILSFVQIRTKLK